jgi:hypothetical protein
MSQTTELTPERKAELDAQRAQRIATSKILNNGVQSPIPFGIMDILFWNKKTKVTTKYTGDETEEGQIMFMLPVRTRRDLNRYAIYSIPNGWKVKFHQGQQVYPITDANGYITKLLPASSMGSSNSFVSTSQVLAQASQKASAEFETPAPEVTEEATKESGPQADGYESEDNPF